MTAQSNRPSHDAAPPVDADEPRAVAAGWLGVIALAWGAGGFLLLLVWAVARLWPLALDSFEVPWSPVHWVVFAVNGLAMAWFEGYRGFQKAYAPRFAARCHHLLRQASRRQALLAPLVCMGLLDAPGRRLRSAWTLSIGIVGVILLYRLLPQPWRGILDAGVVLGLAWGVAATVASLLRALRHGPAVDPEFA